MKSLINRALNKAYHHRGVIGALYKTKPGMEVIYRDLFVRELTRVGIEDDFFPVGGAANYSLLYLILRALTEFPVAAILEVGAGQTTLLIDKVTTVLNRKFDILTLEHDPAWVQHIRQQVASDVRHCLLEPLQVARRRVDYYADPKIDGRKFDLMVLDGPTAFDFRSRYNRLGFLRHLDAIGEDFIIIVDDVERPGEQRLVSEITRALRQRGSTFRKIGRASCRERV